MEFEWDDNKNLTNIRKHGISFEDALEVFSDPMHLPVQDGHVDGEERWRTTGYVEFMGVIVVAHTIRDENAEREVIRIISARRAERWERRVYEEGEDR